MFRTQEACSLQPHCLSSFRTNIVTMTTERTISKTLPKYLGPQVDTKIHKLREIVIALFCCLILDFGEQLEHAPPVCNHLCWHALQDDVFDGPCLNVCMYVCVCACECMFMRMIISARVHACMCVCVFHAYMCVCIFACEFDKLVSVVIYMCASCMFTHRT